MVPGSTPGFATKQPTMDKYFRTQEGLLVNAVEHTLEQIEKWPNLRIYVGSDSQVPRNGKRHRGYMVYATAIVYRYGHRGAHYIFNGEEVPIVKDDFLRLYAEGVRTLEAAELLKNELPVEVTMEFDYAGEKKTLSTMCVGAFKGYQNARFKGGEMISTKAADHIVRHWNELSKK